jgi:hypothetical protein
MARKFKVVPTIAPFTSIGEIGRDSSRFSLMPESKGFVNLQEAEEHLHVMEQTWSGVTWEIQEEEAEAVA